MVVAPDWRGGVEDDGGDWRRGDGEGAGGAGRGFPHRPYVRCEGMRTQDRSADWETFCREHFQVILVSPTPRANRTEEAPSAHVEQAQDKEEASQ